VHAQMSKQKHIPTITGSKNLLMLKLSKFYSVKKNIQTVIDIIQNEDDEKKKPKVSKDKKISLRLIDWFVTNYSKKNNTIIEYRENGNIIHFNVYMSYRSQLKSYKKESFDPFRRRDRIIFQYEKDKNIETTIGQLNMFRWVIENKIIDYINAHFKEIDKDMQSTQKDNIHKKNSDDNIKTKTVQTENGVIVQRRKKRSQLSKSSVKNMNFVGGQRMINFD